MRVVLDTCILKLATFPAEDNASALIFELARAGLIETRVALRSNGRDIVTQTDARGVYRFERVPTGDYMLEVSAPKQVAPIAPVRVVIGNGACASRSFTTEPR